MARRAVALIGLVAVGVLVVGVLPGLQDVRARFARADPAWLGVTFACVLASMLSYVAALRGTLARRVGWRASWSLAMAEQGSNVLLPTGGVGGPAIGALVMQRAGVPAEFAVARSAALFLLTSATSLAAIVVAGTATAAGLSGSGISWVGTLLPAALSVVVVLAVAALGHLPVVQQSATQGFGARWRMRSATLLRDGVQVSIALLRARDPLVIGGCVGYFGFTVAALEASFAAFGGAGPPIGPFVLALTLGQVGALVPSPGGLGTTEGGLIGMLVIYGAQAAPAAAAVLAYRVFQLGLPTTFGLIAFGQIRRRLQDHERTAAIAARFDAE